MSMDRGPQGDHGQDGRDGRTGADGAAGPRGGVTRWQALAMFLVLVLSIVGYGIRDDRREDEGRARDAAMASVVEQVRTNTATIEWQRQQSRYESCVGGVMILMKYNEQQQALADADQRAIDADTTGNEALLAARLDRIDVYEKGLLPLPDCEPLRPDPAQAPPVGPTVSP